MKQWKTILDEEKKLDPVPKIQKYDWFYHLVKLYQMLITVTPSPNWQNIHPLGEPDPDLC